jgi:hypothetical protein
MSGQMKLFLKYSIWIYLLLFVLVIYFALQARKKYFNAALACAEYTQGQTILDYDLEMEKLAERGAWVKIKAGESALGAYPVIEIYEKGSEKAFCRLHIENQKLIFIDGPQ